MPAIMSMTGFGRGSAATASGRIDVEVRSVNQKGLRLSMRLPPRVSALESRLREVVQAGSRRGQIDVFVTLVEGEGGVSQTLPEIGRVRTLVNAWRAIAAELGLSGEIDVNPLIGMTSGLAASAEEFDVETQWPALEESARNALAALDRMRADEGEALRKDMSGRIDWIADRMSDLQSWAESAKKRQAVKIQERVQSLLTEIGSPQIVDRGLLEREIAIAADRSDVSEEVARARSHVEQFRETLAEGGPAGRKLEFITQELHREINTLGAKTSDPESGRTVVEFKSELEKIREQVQNIE